MLRSNLEYKVPKKILPNIKLIAFLPLQRVHFDIQVGEHAIDYANVAQKEKLTELQLRVRQLLDQVDQIAKEQNYQRVRNLALILIIPDKVTLQRFLV